MCVRESVFLTMGQPGQENSLVFFLASYSLTEHVAGWKGVKGGVALG